MPAASGRPAREPSARQLAVQCARAADDHRAQDIVVMDMRKAIPLCDYFVLATGTSSRQMQTVADAVMERMSACGVEVYGVEGYREARWILLDFGDVVVHIFDSEARAYYDLELLWGDSPRVKWQ